MRYSLLLLILICITHISIAQNRAEKKFIRFVIGKENIVYNKTIHSFSINFVREALSKDTLFEWRYIALYEKRGLPDSLIFVLTKPEKAFINEQLDKMKDFSWKDHLFKRSLAVDFETLGAYKKAHEGKLSYNPDDYKNGDYAFTKPIFIRNNTVGFMYITHRDQGKVFMYVKDHRKWKFKYLLDFWIS